MSEIIPLRQAATRAEQRTVHNNARPIPRLNGRKQKQKPNPPRQKKKGKRRLGTRVPKNFGGGGHVHEAFARWVHALHMPRSHRGVPCPVNQNVATSNVVLSATATWTSESVVVEPFKTVQIVLFPGRGSTGTGGASFDNCLAPAGTFEVPEIGPGDAVAVHSRLVGFCPPTQTTPTSSYVVSPIPYLMTFNVSGVETAYTPPNCIGFISSGAAADDALGAGQGTSWFGGGAANLSGKWFAMVPDNPLNITGSSNAGHMRHKLTSMDISARNTTVIGNRGGNMVVCQPSNRFYDAGASNSTWSQQRMQLYRTFQLVTKDHGDSLYTSWIPRPGELAYSHPMPDLTSHTTLQNAVLGNSDPYVDEGAVYVFLNNPTGASQTYTVEVVQNFDFAGQGVSQLGSEAEHHPQMNSAVEKGIAIATNGTETVGHAMLTGAQKSLEAVAGRVDVAAHNALEHLRSTLARQVPRAGAALVGAVA